MRYRKVVRENNSVKSTYDYVYSDGRLVTITYTANGTSKTARFIYDSYGEVRGFILDNSATYLYLKNAQGDITAIVDENGAVILTCTYDAWGVVTFGATSMESMALAAELSKINPFTYRGYCYDYDIEMYYLQSRYYDPEICRFINADSTDYLGATGTFLSYNLFAYCENEPVGCVDPSGKYLYNFSMIPYKTARYTWVVGSTIYMNGLSKSFAFSFVNGILKISNNMAAMSTIIKRKWLEPLAFGMCYAARFLVKNSLYGRTELGIRFELLIHYIMYVGLKDRKRTEAEDNHFKRFKYTDIGSISPKSFGYDSNAHSFEKFKYLYAFFLSEFYQKKYTSYALYKMVVSFGIVN